MKLGLLFILIGTALAVLACQAPSGFLPAPSHVPSGPLPGPIVESGSQTIAQGGGVGATGPSSGGSSTEESDGDSDTSVTSVPIPSAPSSIDSTGSPMMDTPPIAGPSDQKNPKPPIPISGKDIFCLFEVEKERLVIHEEGSPPETSRVVSQRPIGDPGEVVGLYLWKDTADGMEAVEFPSDLIPREDLDPVKTGLQISTEIDAERAGHLAFTFVGSQSGIYRFSVAGSHCKGGGAIVVMRELIGPALPPPERKLEKKSGKKKPGGGRQGRKVFYLNK